MLVARRDGCIQTNFDAELHERAQRIVGLRLLECGEHARSRFDQHDLRAARVDAAEIRGERETRELGDRAGELDARGPRADDDEAQQALAASGIGFHLGRLEGAEDMTANARRVVDRLERPAQTGAQSSWPK